MCFRNVPLIALLIICSGCNYFSVFYDGCFIYHIRGVAISDTTGKPAADVNIIFQLYDSKYLEPNEVDYFWYHNFYRTDVNGVFSGGYNTGLSWGYTKLFDIIPLGSTTPPFPPKLKSIFIGLKPPGLDGYIQEVNVTPDMQKRAKSAERWIELGTIKIREH